VFEFNFITAVLLCIVYSYNTAKKGVVLSPHMIYWIVLIYVIYIPNMGKEAKGFEYDLMYLIANLGGWLACSFYKIPIYCENKFKKVPVNIYIYILSSIYALFMLYTIINIIVTAGGVINALEVSRLDSYLTSGILKGRTFELLMLLPTVAYYLLIGKLFETGKFVRSFVLIMLLVIYFFFIANTRLPIIMPLMAFAVIVVNRYKPIDMRLLMPVVLTFGIVFVLVYSVFASSIRNGRIHDIGEIAENFFEESSRQDSGQLGYYDWVYDLYVKIDKDEIDHDFGAAWLYYSPLSFIPRSLWKEKPITSTSNRLTEMVYDQQVGSGTLIYTFTIIGEAYWQFSYIGVFIVPFLLIGMYILVFNSVSKLKYSSYWQGMILIEMIPFVRAELPIVQVMLNLMILSLIFFLLSNFLKIEAPK